MTADERYAGSIVGCAVGDALGVPVEGEDRGSFHVDAMSGDDIFPAGTWSDDTSLTLCMAEALGEHGVSAAAEDAFLRKASSWLHEGYLSASGEAFGIGGTTRTSLERFEAGCPVRECGGRADSDNGNGSLMRIAPLAFFLRHVPSFEDRARAVEGFSSLTHAHPRSVMACIIFVEFLIRLYEGDGPSTALSAAARRVRDEAADEPAYFSQLGSFARLFDGSIADADEESVRSGGYVVDTLEAALWCLLRHDSFERCVLAAVNLGGDSDTTAAVAGAAAGVHYGLGAVPDEWFLSLANADTVLTCARRGISEVKGETCRPQGTPVICGEV